MVILPQPITHIHTHPPYRQSLHLVLLIWLTLIRRRLSVSLVMVTAAMQGSVPWAAMTVIKSTPPNNAKMRALSILVHPVIVWINPVPIMLPTVNVVPKIVPQVRQHLVMEKLSDKRLVETVVKNVVMILVLQVILNQQCLNVTIQVRRNAVPFVIKRKIVIRVPGIMIVAEAGNIAKGRLVPKIHQNVRFIVTAIIFHIAVLLLLFVLLTEVFTVYRNGYCSKSCGTSGSSEPSVSECEDPGCDVNAYCSGSYCYCNAGYTGSGTSCSPDLCYGVTCPKANMECINLFDGYCKCRSGWGNNSSGECQENYGSEWLCCTKEERAWDGDNASECLASGSFGEADSFYSQCEAQGGTPSRSGSYSHGGRYNVCAYTCTFSAEHFPI